MESETKPIVGEDGELIQPDTSVNPNVYANTHVHRDPLLFRIREHVSYYGCAYLCLATVVLTVLTIALLMGAPVLTVAMLFFPLLYIVAMGMSPKNHGPE